MRFPVVNVRGPRLGDWPTTTYGVPFGPGTTGVSPWDLATQNGNLQPQQTTDENTADIWSGKANQQKVSPAPPPPPPPYVSDILENPENPTKPLPKFITEEEASQKMNLTGLAVTGGAFAALVAAGLVAFR